MIFGLDPVDLIILPEMFTTGFDMQPEVHAQTMDGDAVHSMKYWAAQSGASIIASMIIRDSGHYYNRCLHISTSTTPEYYDKRHLFSLAGEHQSYKAGNRRMIFDIDGWKIFPQICYDLRFPVWSRNTFDYDLAVYVANWPESRIRAWSTLLRARAIENQCYVIGVNRVGNDPNGNYYSGMSAAISYDGGCIREASSAEEIVIVELDRLEMLSYRSRLDFLADRDKFVLE